LLLLRGVRYKFMFLLNMRIRSILIKGGDTDIEYYLIHHQLSGVKDCSRGRLKISHTVY
jgi:hypothetical protein